MPSDEQAAQQIDRLRQTLGQQLPDYMVPSQFVYLEKLPLNSSGKLDRKALPKPEKRYRSQQRIAPNTDVERGLAALWAKVLGLSEETISVEDNFFSLGGDSIRSIRLVFEAKTQGLGLSIQDIFNYQTLRDLAQAATRQALDMEPSPTMDVEEWIQPLLPIQTAGHKPPLFLIHAGGGLGFEYLKLRNMLPEQPIYAIQNPRFGQAEGFASLAEMASCYLNYIKEIQPQGPYLLGGWSFGGYVALELATQLVLQGESVTNVILIDTLNRVGEPLIDFNPALAHQALLPALVASLGESAATRLSDGIKRESQQVHRLLQDYQPPVYSGRIALLKADQLDLTESGLPSVFTTWYQKVFADPYLGWQEVLPQLEIISVAGKHEHLFSPASLSSVKAALQQVLTQPAANLQGVSANLFAAAARNDDALIRLFLAKDEKLSKAIDPLTGWSLLDWATYHQNTTLIDLPNQVNQYPTLFGHVFKTQVATNNEWQAEIQRNYLEALTAKQESHLLSQGEEELYFAEDEEDVSSLQL